MFRTTRSCRSVRMRWERLRMIRAISGCRPAGRDQPGHVVGRRHVALVEPRRVRETRLLQAQLGRHRVHAADEAVRAPARGPRQHPRGDVVGRHQREVHEIAQRDPLAPPQVGGRRAADVAPGDDHVAAEVGVLIEEQHRRHHLGDAGDGARLAGVQLPHRVAGGGVEDDRRRGAHARPGDRLCGRGRPRARRRPRAGGEGLGGGGGDAAQDERGQDRRARRGSPRGRRRRATPPAERHGSRNLRHRRRESHWVRPGRTVSGHSPFSSVTLAGRRGSV